MRDLQNERDQRNIPLDRVGVSDLSYPIEVRDRDHQVQRTVARIAMAVSLPRDYRGTHMSRFVEVLESLEGQVTLPRMESLVQTLQERLDAESAEAEFRFPYFLRRHAPRSGAASLTRYDVAFRASRRGDRFDLVTTVRAPVLTLCPCSREISEAGAHNQRAHVTLSVRMGAIVWIEELADLAERCASCPVFSLLKREDEKHVTERAYHNPRFVEDVAREAALELDRDSRVLWYRVTVTSHESIHNHDAFASLERDRRPPEEGVR